MKQQLPKPVPFAPARRVPTPVFVGLTGPSGSGKTFSALRLAKGLARGGRIGVIDTENGRALHYAKQFAFEHALLPAPYTPEAYLAQILAAEAAGFAVVVVDSFSHVWDGEGGLHDLHEALLDKICGEDWKKRERLNFGLWREPKARHTAMLHRLEKLTCHLIVCLRAKEGAQMKEKDGRTEVVAKDKLPLHERWRPICEDSLPYSLTANLLLLPEPGREGVPVALKVQGQHRAFFAGDRQIDEAMGAALAEWAAGDPAAAKQTPKAATAEPARTEEPRGDLFGEAPAGPPFEGLAIGKPTAFPGPFEDFYQVMRWAIAEAPDYRTLQDWIAINKPFLADHKAQHGHGVDAIQTLYKARVAELKPKKEAA